MDPLITTSSFNRRFDCLTNECMKVVGKSEFGYKVDTKKTLGIKV